MNITPVEASKNIIKFLLFVASRLRIKPAEMAKIIIEIISPKDHTKLKAIISPIYFLDNNLDEITTMKNPHNPAIINNATLFTLRRPLS